MRLTQPNSVFKVSHGNDIWSKALTSSCLRNCICVFSDPVQANASAKAQSFSIQIHIQHAFLKPTVALSDLGRIKICIFLHVSIGLLDASLLPSQSCHRATDQWQRLGLSLSCCSAACSNWTNACCIITTQVVTCDCHSARGANHMTHDITKALLFMNKWHSQWIKIKHNFKVWYVTMHLTYSNEIWTWCSHIASVLVGAWSYMCPLARQQIHPASSVPKVLVPNLVYRFFN